MIQFLSDKAICICPHGGKLQFMPTHRKADGMDGSALTLQDYQNAMIVGCTMPPPPAGVSPCLKVMIAIDPMGQAMTINGTQAVTQMVVSFSDKGWPLTVVNPGMSAMSIKINPNNPSFQKAEFAQASAQKQSGLGIGTSGKGSSSTKPYKDVIMAHWLGQYARRKQDLTLKGRTLGFSDGTPATLLIYQYDLKGKHTFKQQLTGAVKNNEVKATWHFDYSDDVQQIPSKLAGAEYYFAPEYFFDLKVGGKSARSGLIEFRDWFEIKLVDRHNKPVAGELYRVILSNGKPKEGVLDENGSARLEDIDPGTCQVTFPNLDKRAWDKMS